MHETQANGVGIVRTPTGLGVGWLLEGPAGGGPWRIEVNYYGRLLAEEWVDPVRDLPWRDAYLGVDMLACGVRVSAANRVLAELPPPPAAQVLPFMVPRPVQLHVTEHYVSVPPALTITDPRGDVWTLGFEAAPPDRSPAGEYAFEVLRNGRGTGEVASRIERRGGKVRVFTRHGWKRLAESGREFI
jgi:hypothetical protein